MSGRTRCSAAGAPVSIGFRFWPVFAGVFLCAGGKPILNNTPPLYSVRSKVSPKFLQRFLTVAKMTWSWFVLIVSQKKLRDSLYMANPFCRKKSWDGLYIWQNKIFENLEIKLTLKKLIPAPCGGFLGFSNFDFWVLKKIETDSIYAIPQFSILKFF